MTPELNAKYERLNRRFDDRVKILHQAGYRRDFDQASNIAYYWRGFSANDRHRTAIAATWIMHADDDIFEEDLGRRLGA